MKITFDEGKAILKELVNLYLSLPEDLRTTNDIIHASELIFEATEYINFLKDALAFRAGKANVNKALDDPWSVHGSIVKTKGTQTALNVIPRNPVVHQTLTAPRGVTQQRVVHTVTPDGKDTIKTFVPKPPAIDIGLGIGSKTCQAFDAMSNLG